MIYRGYAIFRRCNGRIIEFPHSDPNFHGSLATIGLFKIIEINSKDLFDDKLETIIHELLHLGYEYGTKEFHIVPGLPIPKDIGYSKEQAIEYLNNLEKFIEEETKKILQCQPILVNHLRELIKPL